MTTFAGGYVILNPIAVNELLRGPTGPVFRRLIIDAETVKLEARRLCPVSVVPPVSIPYKKPKLPPGQLRDSIVKRIVELPGGPSVIVGSDKPYAMYVHEGTQPHEILAKNSPFLVFYWRGAVQFRKMIPLHPGNKPNRFLTRALAVLAGRYRVK